MRRGFTVLELLVASLLLSMLVTVLTMIFNQSSIAWRTGVADVAELNVTRAQLGTFHDIEDDALPGLGQSNVTGGQADNREMGYRTVSLFRNWSGSGSIQPRDVSSSYNRPYDVINWSVGRLSPFSVADARTGEDTGLDAGRTRSRSAYIVGVRSAGPDRRFSTEDDISTYPEEAK